MIYDEVPTRHPLTEGADPMACQTHCQDRPNHIHDDEALRLLADCIPARAIAEAHARVAEARARKEA